MLTYFGQRHDDAPGLLELTVRTAIVFPPPDDIFSVTWEAPQGAGIVDRHPRSYVQVCCHAVRTTLKSARLHPQREPLLSRQNHLHRSGWV
jgi:hypothetical protein